MRVGKGLPTYGTGIGMSVQKKIAIDAAGAAREREWLLPSAIMTALLGAAAAWLVANRTTTTAAVAGMMLAGIDIHFFMWIKPEVTALSPFWADALYTDIDRAIFRTEA